MRGTEYAIAEIIWWMLAAAVIGAVIGWMLRYWYGGGRSRKEAEAKIEAQKGRYSEISEELGKWKVKGEKLVNNLDEKTSELATMAESRGELETSLATATNELAALQATHAACGVTAEGHAGEIAALESRIAELSASNRELQDQVAASVAAHAVGSDLESLAAAEEEDADASGQMAMETETAVMAVATPPLTRFGTAGADHTDDLKVINGIGPKLEGVLNGYGIESWEQLAELSEDEITAVDEALEEFPGRIQRDEWVQQATDLIRRFPEKVDRPDRKAFLNESPSQ
ncbi:MAG: hypothetical protein GY720_09010 [bacterium]|nr:hypothetical protein [bacterium]